MLSVIKIKADGIQIIDVVDTKYEKLGTTMAKGKKRTEGHAKAMQDLKTISEKNKVIEMDYINELYEIEKKYQTQLKIIDIKEQN